MKRKNKGKNLLKLPLSSPIFSAWYVRFISYSVFQSTTIKYYTKDIVLIYYQKLE